MKLPTPSFVVSVATSVAAAALVSSSASAQQAVQWRVEDGGNGHWYALSSEAVPLSRTAFIAAAAAVGASPVMLSSQAEELFVHARFGNVVLGLSAIPGASAFTWMADPNNSYSNWGTSACPWGPYPNNPTTAERFAELQSANCSGTQGISTKWDDYQLGEWPASVRILLEWSADCNNDGIVDYGQIIDGSLGDANGNWLPDVCENTSQVRRVPQEYPSIQSAIDASTNGDLVTVEPGFYEEVIRFGGRGITVRSTAGAAVTTIARPIDSPSSPVVTFDADETASAVLSGFTISRGTGVFTSVFSCGCDGYQLGGGVFVNGASPVIQYCVIANNVCGTYYSRGGGVYVGGGGPVFEHCEIRNNQANGGYGSGGGIHVAGGSPQFLDCTVRHCSVQSYHSGNCGGIAVAGGAPYFINCRVTGNSASGGVGGLCVSPSTSMERVYVGSLNGSTPISGEFSDAGGNVTNGDCNENGVPDHSDIAQGVSTDNDADGMPDECMCRHYPATCCPGDVIPNGLVDGVDLAALLIAWGTSGGDYPRSDTNEDGIVDGGDLAVVLTAWGPCLD